MKSPLGRVQHYQNTGGNNRMRPTRLIAFQKPQQFKDPLDGVDYECSSGNFSALVPSVTPFGGFDEVNTQVNLAVQDKPLLYRNRGNLDDLARESQVTQIIPVIEVSGGFSKQRPQDTEVTDYTSHLRKLIKSSGIYALAAFVTPLVSLVLSPFLTHHLSRADYGALAVINTAVALLAGFTQFGLGSAFFRSYNFDYESQKDRRHVLSTIVALLLLVSVPVTISVMVAAPWLSILLFNNLLLANNIRLAAVVVLLQNLTVPGYAWLRAENRAVFFAALSIANLLMNLIVTVFMVGVMHAGIAGSLIATSCGYALVSICTLPIILQRAGVRMRMDIAYGMLAFGLPNVGNYIAIWVLQLSDRFLLERLGSLSQTASYAVAYSLGSLLNTLVLAPFQLAWPSILFTIAKRKDARQIFRLVFRWYCVVLLFAAFGASVASTYIFDVLFPPAYHSAAAIIPIITVSTMFYGVYAFLTLGISIRRKTWIAFVLMTVSALVNLGLNFILIPLYGAMGAALSTLVGYLLLAIMAFVINRRIYPIPFELGPLAGVFLIGIALYMGSNFLAQGHETVKDLGISFGALVAYAGLLACFAKLMAHNSAGEKLTTTEGV